jgi:hypothetical protein
VKCYNTSQLELTEDIEKETKEQGAESESWELKSAGVAETLRMNGRQILSAGT